MQARHVVESVALTLLSLLAACGASQPTQVVSVASHDLGCDQVDVSEVARDRYAAYGCGRGAVYARVCDGGSCRWGRLRHGHEESIAAGAQPPSSGGQREIVPAPPPAQREVVPAPAPVPDAPVAAPAPSSAAPSASEAQTAQPAPAAPVPAAAVGTQPPTDSALQANAAPASAPIALSQGYLSDPYQTQVPAQPIAQTVIYPPPAPLVETRPYPPARNHVWVNGWWWWGPANWVWVPGYWCPPYGGYSYIASSWYWSGGYWRFSPGGWGRPGSGLIVHRGFYPRASNNVTVRAFTPYRSSPINSGGVHRVTAQGGYRPSGSPLYPSRGVVRAAPSGGYGYGSSGYRGGSSYGGSPGRVVAPNTTVRPPASYGGGSRSGSYGGRYQSTPSYGGGNRSYSGGGSSYGGSGGRSYSGGSSYGGGGGRSYSGGGGGGGGGRSMGSVRVSPGGGGGRRR